MVREALEGMLYQLHVLAADMGSATGASQVPGQGGALCSRLLCSAAGCHFAHGCAYKFVQPLPHLKRFVHPAPLPDFPTGTAGGRVPGQRPAGAARRGGGVWLVATCLGHGQRSSLHQGRAALLPWRPTCR